MSRPDGLLKMSELAQRSGVSATTIKHYLREGLLDAAADGVVRTSRNMAWYPQDFVDRIQLIRRLQGERHLPLSAIREVLDRALAMRDGARTPREEVEGLRLPAVVLDRLEELGVLTPDEHGYDADDLAVIEAMQRFRAGGFDEALGFTVYDTRRYQEALAPLVREEVRVLLERLAGEVEPQRAAEIIGAGREPLRELIGAMHSKMLLQELRRQRGTA